MGLSEPVQKEMKTHSCCKAIQWDLPIKDTFRDDIHSSDVRILCRGVFPFGRFYQYNCGNYTGTVSPILYKEVHYILCPYLEESTIRDPTVHNTIFTYHNIIIILHSTYCINCHLYINVIDYKCNNYNICRILSPWTFKLPFDHITPSTTHWYTQKIKHQLDRDHAPHTRSYVQSVQKSTLNIRHVGP